MSIVSSWLKRPEEMLAWFKAKLQDFYLLPAKIEALRARSRALKEVAERKGRQDAVSQLASVDTSLARLSASHTGLQTRLAEFWGKLGALGIKPPGATLGVIPAIPIALIFVGGAIAVAIASMITEYERQQRIVDAVAKGVLTPQEAAELVSRGKAFGIEFDVGKVLVPVAIIAALAFLGPRMARKAA